MKNKKNVVAEKIKNAAKAAQRAERIKNSGGAVKASTMVHKNPKTYTRKSKHKVSMAY